MTTIKYRLNHASISLSQTILYMTGMPTLKHFFCSTFMPFSLLVSNSQLGSLNDSHKVDGKMQK